MTAEFIVHVQTKPFDDDLKLYKRKDYILKPGLTSLVGCNGSGKTTFIDCFLVHQLRKQKIEFYKYNDRREGGSHLMDSLLNRYGDMNGLAQMFLSSEGERIVYGLTRVIQGLPRFFDEHRGKPAFLILDAIDSGMSVDEIIEIREVLLDTIIPDAKQRFDVDLFVVIAANNFEWCNDKAIVNMDITDGKELKFNSYEDYRKHILKTRQFKDKQRGADND